MRAAIEQRRKEKRGLPGSACISREPSLLFPMWRKPRPRWSGAESRCVARLRTEPINQVAKATTEMERSGIEVRCTIAAFYSARTRTSSFCRAFPSCFFFPASTRFRETGGSRGIETIPLCRKSSRLLLGMRLTASPSVTVLIMVSTRAVRMISGWIPCRSNSFIQQWYTLVYGCMRMKGSSAIWLRAMPGWSLRSVAGCRQGRTATSSSRARKYVWKFSSCTSSSRTMTRSYFPYFMPSRSSCSSASSRMIRAFGWRSRKDFRRAVRPY